MMESDRRTWAYRVDAPDTYEMPPFAEDALIVSVGDPELVFQAVDNYSRTGLVGTGLAAALNYVERNQASGAALVPVYPERAARLLSCEGVGSNGTAWQVAIPKRDDEREALSAFHFLRLSSPTTHREENALLESQLLADFRTDLVYHPAIPYSRKARPDTHQPDLNPHWGIERCGFPGVWDLLDRGFYPGAIGVIDTGGDAGNPELSGKIDVFPPSPIPSTQAHACSVGAIIAAHRNNGGMHGCCSAEIDLYDIAPGDHEAFKLALKAVADTPLRVLNISMEMAFDAMVQKQIAECIKQKVIIVAAMGNSGNDVPVYPAKYDNVIAVGATNQGGAKLRLSNMGDHIWISAPGEYIYSIADAQRLTVENHGTSYSTPMISAAVWLALRTMPHWQVEEIKCLLKRSVKESKQAFRELGHGRLDMEKMCRLLDRFRATGGDICKDI